MTINTTGMRARVEDLKRQNEELIARYGEGIRPAWVGEEIGINWAYIKRYEREIAETEAEFGGED